MLRKLTLLLSPVAVLLLLAVGLEALLAPHRSRERIERAWAHGPALVARPLLAYARSKPFLVATRCPGVLLLATAGLLLWALRRA